MDHSLRGWLAIGILFGVLGSLLLWNGLTRRFDPDYQMRVSDAGLDTAKTEMPGITPTAHAETAPAELPVKSSQIEEINDNVLKQPVKTSTILPEKRRDTFHSKAEGTPSEGSPESIYDPFPADPHKRLLMQWLKKQGWNVGELARVEGLLHDPRAEFRPKLFQVNTTHTETSELYARHLKPESIDICEDFYQREGRQIASAVHGMGVPPEVVTAIMKVETDFGLNAGKEAVFNVFWTLSLGDHPDVIAEFIPRDDPDRTERVKRIKKRASWGRGQLKELLKIAESSDLDPLGINGSWAGAFGLPQFIPASYTAYGRDGDGDGEIDLLNISDAAASIAWYLKQNGWPSDGSPAREKKTVMRYNHSEHYADCVLGIADSLAQRWNGLQE